MSLPCGSDNYSTLALDNQNAPLACNQMGNQNEASKAQLDKTCSHTAQMYFKLSQLGVTSGLYINLSLKMVVEIQMTLPPGHLRQTDQNHRSPLRLSAPCRVRMDGTTYSRHQCTS
jgi:hypothetical protein